MYIRRPTHLINDDVMFVQGDLPRVLQMIILELRPHESGGWLHDLPEWLRLDTRHAGTVIQPQ